MKLIVVGCGRTGATLAQSLDQKGHQVSVIDQDETTFLRLGPGFSGRTYEGVAFDRDILMRAGIQEAQGLAAVTSDEAANMIVCRIAKVHFRVPNVVARLYEPERASLYESMDVATISSVTWRVLRLEQLLCQPMLSIIGTLGNGEVQLAEVQATEGLIGRSVREFVHPGKTTEVAVLQGGRADLPTPDTRLEEGDYLRMAIVSAYLDDFKAQLEAMKKEGRA
jgi:trk system potassium uptake protein TrkA